MIRPATIAAAAIWARTIEGANNALRKLSRHFLGSRGGELREGIEEIDRGLERICSVIRVEAELLRRRSGNGRRQPR